MLSCFHPDPALTLPHPNWHLVSRYSLYDPEVGYCQGSPFIVGLLLMHMPEEDAFLLFIQIMRE